MTRWWSASVMSMMMKFSEAAERRLISLAGKSSADQCQRPSAWCRMWLSSRKLRYSSGAGALPKLSPSSKGSSKAAHLKWLRRI